MTKTRYINEITGEPYLEIDEREPTEEEWEKSKKIKYDFKDKEIHKGTEGAQAAERAIAGCGNTLDHPRRTGMGGVHPLRKDH